MVYFFPYLIFTIASSGSPIGGTLPGRKSKNKPIKDSGSSGPDSSKKSERTKSREKIARKPSKELLRIQNYSDSSDDDFRLMTRKEIISKRHKSNESRSNEMSDRNIETGDKPVTDGTSSKTDIASSLSPSSSKRSPNISRQSHSPKKSSRKSRQSPETHRRKTPPPPTTKSLNMQIKDFIKHSSPPKSRKVSESSNSHFDAFNHTSSSKLSHASFKEHERSPCSKQSSLSQQYSSQYSESYEDYEYYHPRRSSKEVLDFTSSRKSLQDTSANRSSENEQYPLKQQHSHGESKGHKSDDSYYKRKEEHRHCQCLSPKKESSNLVSELRSPSLVREEKEVFDFTSKKANQFVGGTLTRKSRSKDSKVDITRKDMDIHSSPMSKSPRRKEERNVFDFSVTDGSEYATLRKKKKHLSHSKHIREVLDFTSNSERKTDQSVMDFNSGSERRDVLDFTSTISRVENSSLNTSQEMLHLKSSSEFLGSKSSSKEAVQRRHASDVHDKAIDPWPESSHLSLPRQKSDPRKDDYDSLGDSPVTSKADLSNKESLRDTIDPPDLFNPNKVIAHMDDIDQDLYERSANDVNLTKPEVEEPIYASRSGTLKHR